MMDEGNYWELVRKRSEMRRLKSALIVAGFIVVFAFTFLALLKVLG